MLETMPNLSVVWDGDVLVAGGGPAGVAAALSAARSGARVLLVERSGSLGGSATAAQVPAFAPFSDRTRSIVRGIGWEVMTAMQARLGRPLPDPDTYAVPQDTARMDWVPIDVELLKVLYDELCEAAGVQVLFHTQVPEVVGGVGCWVLGVGAGDEPVTALSPNTQHPTPNTLSAVVLANKDGLTLARARVFVDATGDADLAARAGCPFEQGDEAGRTQGMTLCLTLAGGSRTRYLEYVHRTGDGYLAALIAQARANGDYDLPDSSLVGLSFKSETIAGANLGHVYGYDGTSAFSVSDAERAGRKVAQKLLPFLRRYVPGQENLHLVSTGAHIGVRETRRIVGDYRLTVDDYLSCRDFPDTVARNAYFLDLHAVTTEDAARAKSISDGGQERQEKRSYALPPGKSHGIPYRCLLPQGVENLIVAGRSLSADRAVQGAARVMPVCFALGEAAGLASAMATGPNGTARFRDIDTDNLRSRLHAQGAWLGDDDTMGDRAVNDPSAGRPSLRDEECVTAATHPA